MLCPNFDHNLHSFSTDFTLSTEEEAVDYLRNADLKDVVLDQLLPEHDDAELDAQLNEAAPWRALMETHTFSFVHLLITTSPIQPSEKKQMQSRMTNLFHPIIIKDIHVASRSTSKPAKTNKHAIKTERFLMDSPRSNKTHVNSCAMALSVIQEKCKAC